MPTSTEPNTTAGTPPGEEQARGTEQARFLRFLIGGAALIVILLGTRALGDLISPILIAFLLALGLSPLLVSLQRRGMHTAVALFVVIGLLVLIGLVVLFIITTSVSQLMVNLPAYLARFEAQSGAIDSTFQRYGLDLDAVYPTDVTAVISPSVLQTQLLSVSGAILVTLGEVFLVILLFIFLLLDLVDLPKRIAGGLEVKPELLERVGQVRESITHYFVLKTRVNLLAGVMNGALSFAFGIDFALFWGFFAFLAGYIPSFGYTVAALPPIFFAWLQFGLPGAILPAVLLLGAMILTDQVISPRMTARGMNLPISVLLVSMLIWGWLLGLLGALIAGPLTIVLKLSLSNFPETRWIANLMSGKGGDQVAEKIAPRLPGVFSKFFVTRKGDAEKAA